MKAKLVKRNHFFDNPFFISQNLDNLLGDILESPVLKSYPSKTAENFLPVCDVKENESSYSFHIDLPGLKKEDIQIDLADNRLTISGERKTETTSENEKGHIIERVFGKFQRSFDLPKNIDSENVIAKYENGVLNLEIPKSQETKNKKILIQ